MRDVQQGHDAPLTSGSESRSKPLRTAPTASKPTPRGHSFPEIPDLHHDATASEVTAWFALIDAEIALHRCWEAWQLLERRRLTRLERRRQAVVERIEARKKAAA